MEPKCPNCEEANSANADAVKNPNGAVFAWWKQLVLFLVGWIGFQVIANVIAIVILNADLAEIVKSAITNFGGYTVLIIGMGLIAWADWKKLFKSFKGWKPYVFGLAGFAAIMAFSRVWSIICSFIPLDVTDNANQSAATNIVTSYPIIGFIILGFVGPICEELTYRVGLFSLTKRVNRVFGYVITLVIFAFIHFDFLSIAESMKTGNWDIFLNEILNLPFYLFAGLTFTFLYEKYGFASSLAAHVTNNAYSVIMTILLQYLKKFMGE
ncbi:MAG: CPBP family intramembrane metalloprotease [Bacilli bacterium]|nr:CPBP family intramembrane metalloprotease [Bacilli bacterium]